MTKTQAGIAMAVVVLLAGGAGVCYHYLGSGQAAAAPQLVPGSPRSVVYDLLKGMQEGEGELIRRALHAQDTHEAEAVTVLVEYSAAASRLVRLADAAFGKGRLSPPGLPLSRANLEAQVARLNEIVDDELADVDFSPHTTPGTFHLRKIDGRWWVMVRRTFEPAALEDTGPLAEIVESLRGQTKAFSQIADDIEGGRFPTLEQAQSAMGRQLAHRFHNSWHGSAWARYPATMPMPEAMRELP